MRPAFRALLAAFALVISLATPAGALQTPEVAGTPEPTEEAESGGLFSTLLCFVSPYVSGCDGESLVSTVTGVPGDLVGGLAEATGTAVLESLATAMVDGAVWILESSIGWWIDVPSIIGAEGGVVASMSNSFAWVAAALAVMGVISHSIRLIVTRRGESLADLVGSLLMLSFVSAAGWLVVQTLSVATDAWAVSILETGLAGDEVGTRIRTAVETLPPAATILLAILFFITGAIQAGLMLLREVSVILMASLLTFAAGARFFGWGRAVLPRLASAILAVLLYKPIAAATLAGALYLFGNGDSFFAILGGAAMLILSIVALPALMRLFSPLTAGLASGGGGGGGLAAAGLAATAGAALLRSRGRASGGAVEQSSRIQSDRKKIEAAVEPAATASTGAVAAGSTAGGPVGAAAGVAVAGVSVAVQGAKAAADGAATTIGGSSD